MSGSFPHSDNFISAINNPEDLQFCCTWSGDTVDMNVPYVHQPYAKGTWLLIDAEKSQGAGNNAFWNMTTDHPITKAVISPLYIVAIFTE